MHCNIHLVEGVLVAEENRLRDGECDSWQTEMAMMEECTVELLLQITFSSVSRHRPLGSLNLRWKGRIERNIKPRD
jgi:hypothetical protein